MNSVRRFREAKGFTQQELAYLVGVSEKTIGEWERGNQIPRQRTAKALAKRLGVTVEDLELEDEQ